jgi:hypothetical protein
MGGYLVAKKFLQNLLKTMHNQFSLVDNEVLEEHPIDEFEQLVEQARQEWVNAKSYFDNVVDPDLVDYAVYSVEAAERKYMYLLKRARIQDRVQADG